MSLARITAKKLSPTEIRSRVSEVLENILERCLPEKIYLFGSAARNEYTEHSDFDIAIIFSDLEELKKGKKALFSKKANHSYPVDYLFFTDESFKSKLEKGGVCELIVKEGKVVFPKAKTQEPER